MAGCCSYTRVLCLGVAVCSVDFCNMQCAVFSVQCSVCSVQCVVFSFKCKIKQHIVYSVQWLVGSVQGWQVILSAPPAERLPTRLVENTGWHLLQHNQSWWVSAVSQDSHPKVLIYNWVFATTRLSVAARPDQCNQLLWEYWPTTGLATNKQ